MLSIFGRFLGICVSSTTALVRRKRQYWFACGSLLLMLNPMSAHAIPEFVGGVPASDPVNCTTFAGDSSTSFAGVVVAGGCNTALTRGVSVSEFQSFTHLFNREWRARVEFNIVVRPTTDELEVTIELTHKVDPHPADGDAGGGPTYSMTYNCTAGGVCAGHTNSGALFDTYKLTAPETILAHNGPGDHLDIFSSSFSVDVSKADFCIPGPGCGIVGWQIDKWRLEVTGQHIPEPSSLALLAVAVVALSLGRYRHSPRLGFRD